MSDYDYDEAIALQLTFDWVASNSTWFVEVSEGYSGSSTSLVGTNPLEILDGALEWAQSSVTVSGEEDFLAAMETLEKLKTADFEVKFYVEPRAAASLLEFKG